MRRHSPYNYGFNNPIRFVDPDGMAPVDWYRSEDGTLVKWFEGSGEQEGFENIGTTNKVVSTGLPGGDKTVNLNADGTATDAATGEAATMSHGGGIAIEARKASDVLSEGQKSLMWMNSAGLKINEVMRFINALRLLGEGMPAAPARLATVPTASAEMTTVGRWMSKAEYEMMVKTGRMVEGAGGQTFVATGGSGSFNAAAKGAVYAEFQVPTNSLLQGGQANWFKAIGPSAGKAMQGALQKQGGQLLPQVKNISPVLQVK